MRIAELEDEVNRLRQGLWDCAKAAGEDLDGDEASDALVFPDIVEFALRAVRDGRATADERYAELEAENERLTVEMGRGRAVAEIRRLREALEDIAEETGTPYARMASEALVGSPREIAEVQKEMTDGQRHWKARLEMLRRRKQELLETRRLCLAGASSDEQDLAKSVVRVRGSVQESAGGAFDAAVQAIASGGTALCRQYIGAKRYECFHQRCDCEYGYGPKHGSIVFAVALTDEAQRRLREGELLTEQERDAAVKYLMALATPTNGGRES